MGVVIPQVVSEDRASGAQIVDGGLRFDSGKSQGLTITPGSAGNRSTWTWSGWTKRNIMSVRQYIFSATSGGSNSDAIYFHEDNTLRVHWDDGLDGVLVTTQLFRDPSAWYHLLWSVDFTQSTSTNRVKLYVNGTQITSFSTSTYPSQNYANGDINNTVAHAVGRRQISSPDYYLSAQLSNVYLIDGQALDPSYFGYTDPLTNTWRPKKLSSSVAFGTNGFYLPFDGSAPIGQDQSGRGNNWTPVNFGGSNTIEKATGALPILNTDGGGKVARVGVRTDNNPVGVNTFCKLALPLVGIKSDFCNQVSSGIGTNKSVTDGGITYPTTQSNFYGGSAFFNNSSTGDVGLTIPNSSDFNFGTGDFTIEFWIYNTVSNRRQWFLRTSGQDDNATSGFLIEIGSSNNIYLVSDGSGPDLYLSAQSLNTWNHYAFTRSGTTLRCFINGRLDASSTNSKNVTSANDLFIGRNLSGYSFGCNMYLQDIRIYKGLAKYTSNFIPASTDPDIVPDSPSGVSYSSNVALVPSTDGAVAFDGSGDYLSISSPPTDIRDWYTNTNFTLEYFVYANAFGSSANGGSNVLGHGNTGTTEEYWSFGPKSGGTVIFYYWSGSQNSFSTTQTLSIGKWHHLAFVKSSTSLKIYIDGIESASSTLSVTPQSSASLPFLIGKVTSATEFNGFISNINLVNGTALYTSNFTPPSAPISSVANTKLLCCKSNSSATAADVTPGTITANGNAAATNFNPFTVNINTQRGKQSGYATLNPLDRPSSSSVTLSNGNLRAADGNSGLYSLVVSNIGFTTSNTETGYYLEVLNPNTLSGNPAATGFSLWYPQGGVYSALYPPGRNTYNPNNGFTYNVAGTSFPWGSSFVSGNPTWSAAGSVFSVAVKGSNVWVAVNGIWVNGGNPATNTSPFTTIPAGYSQVFPAYLGLETGTLEFNFGQKPFKFPPPAGFQPLTLANTPRPTIVRPDQYVGITTWKGDNGTQSLNTGFKPDLVWIKNRNTAGIYHNLFDTVRGAGKRLATNVTDVEATNQIYGYLSAFNTNGFTVTAGSSGADNVNLLNENYVAWAWKAGGNSNTFNINDVGYATASAAGLTAGTITPTGASVNTKSGFSIIKVPGTASAASFSHGLGQAPAFVILKETNGTGDWQVGHKSLSSGAWTSRLGLNLTTAEETTISAWNNTPPTSSLITVGATSNVDNNFIVYAWAEIPGFSKFGSFSGNNSTDGTAVTLGFRPKFIIIKCIQDIAGDVEQWIIRDTTRSSYNPANANLYANLSNAEDDASGYSGSIDILSNGFKMRGTYGGINASATYIYACWAETPTFNLYGAMSNAR